MAGDGVGGDFTNPNGVPETPPPKRHVECARLDVPGGLAGGAASAAPPPTCAPTGQNHENDAARVIVVCTPGLSKTMGALHPVGALWEGPVNLLRTRAQHKDFVERLEAAGATVHDVRAVLERDARRSVTARLALEDLAARCLSYELHPDAERIATEAGSGAAAARGHRYHVSREYKALVLEKMDVAQLVEIVLTRPTVTVVPSMRDTGLTASYAFNPLANIIFCRDQQVTTRKGVVMARLRSTQRHHEVDVLEFCLRKLFLRVIGRIPEPDAFLEGGDFFPAGPDLCFIGVGPRTNMQAVSYMLEHDMFGTRRVAVVRDDYERRQERMHLDTVFNLLSSDCVLMLRDMMGDDSPTRRLVDEWVRDADGAPYVKGRTDVEFSQYVRENGYNIIPIDGEDQLAYGCNALNLGEGRLLTVHQKTAREIARSPYFQGDVQFMPFDSVTAMYGAVHCCSQVVERCSQVVKRDEAE